VSLAIKYTEKITHITSHVRTETEINVSTVHLLHWPRSLKVLRVQESPFIAGGYSEQCRHFGRQLGVSYQTNCIPAP
jgi:hypothetical protein